MELPIINTQNQEVGKKKLPSQFDEVIRPDLIRRAVLAIQSHKRQPYGAYPLAGKEVSAKLSRRRRKYRGSYGYGMSRVPRKVLSRRGTRFYYVGAFAPGTVGGRRAHPPKAVKNWYQKINVKERRKAIRSALAAVLDKELVKSRGHKIPDNYPFVIANDFETISSTKELRQALTTIGFGNELERTGVRKIRAGKGKMRGRKYVVKKGILFVVSNNCSLIKSASNISGVEVVTVESLNTELLAPGTHPGRLTLFTENAIDRLEKESLFSIKKGIKKDIAVNEKLKVKAKA